MTQGETNMNLRTITAAAIAVVGLAGTSAFAQCGGCSGNAKPPTVAQAKAVKGVQKATVVINAGYTPSTINAKVGKPLEITFKRTEESSCGEEIVFKSLGIRKSVANGKTVVVKFTPKKAGVIEFTCGMNMYKGKVVVK
jgi:plastocyanin domain-containing protein